MANELVYDKLAEVNNKFQFLAQGGFSESYIVWRGKTRRVIKIPSIKRVSENTIDSLFDNYLDTKKPTEEQLWNAIEQVLKDEYQISKELSENPLFRKCYNLHPVIFAPTDENQSAHNTKHNFIGIEFEYVPGKTILNAITCWNPNLSKRIAIAKYCANVVDYFHSNKQIMGDIKSNNFIVNPFTNLAHSQLKRSVEDLQDVVRDANMTVTEQLEEAYNLEPTEECNPSLLTILHSVDWTVKAIDLGGVSTKNRQCIRGSRLVMAPEQSDVYATQKTDIFSLGVIMSQIMIDVPPLELLITTYDNGRKKSRREKNLTQTNIDSLQYHLGRHMKERHGSHAQITGVAEVVQSMFEYKPENRPSAREITAYLHNI